MTNSFEQGFFTQEDIKARVKQLSKGTYIHKERVKFGSNESALVVVKNFL